MGPGPYEYQNSVQVNNLQDHFQNQSQNVYKPPQKRTLEDTLQTFIQSQQATWNQNEKAIDDIRTQLTKLTIAMVGLQNEKGKFSAQP